MSSSWSHWDPLTILIFCLVSSAAVLAALVIFELRRRQRFLFWRIVAECLIVISVLLLLFRPQFKSVTGRDEFVLLTKNFEKEKADSLKAANGNLKFFRLADSENFEGATEVKSLESISDKVRFIVGDGLPAYILAREKFNGFTFLPSPSAEGIEAIEYPKEFFISRWNILNGIYNSKSAQKWLRLVGPGGPEDSVLLEGYGKKHFTLSFFPRIAGRISYQLEAHSDSLENSVYELPVNIQAERKMKILFLSDYPTFEQRQLKSFLSAKGHMLAVRNRVSRAQYKLEFAHQPAMSLSQLTPTILGDIDLLILDSRSYSALTQNEKKQVSTAIEGGLGVLLIPDGGTSSTAKSSEELIQFNRVNVPDTIRISLGRAGDHLLPQLPIAPVKRNTAIISAPNDRTLTGYLPVVQGKIGFQLLSETYQLALKGNGEAYAEIWTPLLETLGRAGQTSSRITVQTPFPWYDNEPIDVNLYSTSLNPSMTIDSLRVPLIEDIDQDDLWHGTVWLEGNGWHQLRSDSTRVNLRLSRPNDWQSLRVSQQKRLNEIHQDKTEDVMEITRYEEGIAPVIYFLVALLCFGFLWLAPKL